MTLDKRAGSYTADTPLESPRERLSRAVAESPAVIPMLLTVAIFIVLGASEAGFYPAGSQQHEGLGWLPATLMLLVLLAVTVVTLGAPRNVPRPVLAGVGLFAAYTAWSYLSITWAEQQGAAWTGATRTSAYLLILCLFSLWPVRPGAARVVVGAFGLGIAALGLIEALRAHGAEDPFRYFIDARFSEPAGYINANVALWTLGMLPCVWLAATRGVWIPVRALALGGAGLLACLAVMGQSRGGLVALPLAVLVLLVLTPWRLRLGLAALAVAAGAFFAREPLLAVHDDYEEARFGSLVAEAVDASLAVGGILVVVGLVVAVAGSFISPGEGRARATNMAAAAVVAILAVGGSALFVAREGSPVTKVEEAWEDFKDGGGEPQAGASRFSSAGTNRYDFWRVGMARFRDEPVKGIGVENFQLDYLAQGDSGEQPRYAHSIEVEVLSQTGLVGAALLLGSFLASLVGGVLRRGRRPVESRAVAGVSIAIFAYWLLHTSVDWFWAFVGLTGPAIAMLGLAAAVREPSGPGGGAPRAAGRGSRAGFAAALTAAVALATGVSALWLSEREFARASQESAPGAAYERLDRAASLNPLSARPHLLAGSIALRAEDQGRAAAELREALELEPRSSYALAMLGALASEQGDGTRARRLLERAEQHSPRSEVVRGALARISSGRKVATRDLANAYRAAARGRVRTVD